MKKIILSLAIALSGYYASAQNTYPWPSTGNVGIGTSSPAGKFQIVTGAMDILTANTTLDIGIGGAVAGWGRAFRVVNTSGSNGLDGGAFGVRGNGTIPSYIYMSIPTSEPIGYASTKILALNNSGNVGIGTTNPVYKLVVSNSAANGFEIDPTNSGGTQTLINSFNRTTSSYTPMLFFGSQYVFQNGSVGIGTTQPDQKLTVNGTVHSKEVKVDTSIPIPDYVFEKSYKLPDLSQLKNYLESNHHLPEIPSAAEIEKNGLNLGQMNLKLLKKVEELTLYVIDKDRQIVDQNALLAKEEKKNDEQEARIAALEKALQQLTVTK